MNKKQKPLHEAEKQSIRAMYAETHNLHAVMTKFHRSFNVVKQIVATKTASTNDNIARVNEALARAAKDPLRDMLDKFRVELTQHSPNIHRVIVDVQAGEATVEMVSQVVVNLR